MTVSFPVGTQHGDGAKPRKIGGWPWSCDSRVLSYQSGGKESLPRNVLYSVMDPLTDVAYPDSLASP